MASPDNPPLPDFERAVTVPKEEFTFKNGVFLPHHEYLFGLSEASGHFVVGKMTCLRIGKKGSEKPMTIYEYIERVGEVEQGVR